MRVRCKICNFVVQSCFDHNQYTCKCGNCKIFHEHLFTKRLDSHENLDNMYIFEDSTYSRYQIYFEEPILSGWIKTDWRVSL